MSRLAFTSMLLFMLGIISFCSICNAEERHLWTFVGPYFISYNDSYYSNEETKLVLELDDTPLNFIMIDEEGVDRVVVFSLIRHNTLVINIGEDLGGDAEEFLLSDDGGIIQPTTGAFSNISTEEYERRIAGFKGTVEVSQDNNGSIKRQATFRMRVKTSCNDPTDGQLVRVIITGIGYTEKDFDRLLDTFAIERYMATSMDSPDY